MILDRLVNAELYRGLPARLVLGLEYLRTTDLMGLSLGKHEIDGERLFALVQEYVGKPDAECAWEAHRKYCDVQFVATSAERIGYATLGRMTVKTPYDDAKDVAFFSGEGDYFTLRAGMFAIFAPQDVHMPCLSAGDPSPVRKIVIKALIGA